MLSRYRWFSIPPVLQKYNLPNGNVIVLRDDLIEGGSKLRFLPFLIEPSAREVVFGGPFCGGAPYALSVLGRDDNLAVTLFYAKRRLLHPKQVLAKRNGAKLVFVSPGYMTVVQARAKDYATKVGAQFLPLGFDLPLAIKPLEEFVRKIKSSIGSPDQIWCAVGSGMLCRTIASVFSESRVFGVAVGLKSRHEGQKFSSNVSIIDSGMRFEIESPDKSPFSSCGNYDRKAWALCCRKAKGSVLFWNVAGSPVV